MATPRRARYWTGSSGHCSSEKGISGDKSCPKLEEFSHCRYCPEFIEHARTLFERPPPADYLEQWKLHLASPTDENRRETTSFLVFRLGVEIFALPAALVREVASDSSIHSVPLRSNMTFLGLVNIRGELHLCASLRNLLKTDNSPQPETGREQHPRMVIMEKNGTTWAFQADEIRGIFRTDPKSAHEAPLTVSASSSACTKYLIRLEDRDVACLDGDVIFSSLERSLN